MHDRSGDALWEWWQLSSRQQRSLRKDEPLFHRGDAVAVMFRVEQGLVRLERRTIDGRLLILHSAKSGELLAEASLFGETYHCDASAAEASVVSLCPKEELLAAMVADPVKALQFARIVARQLQALRHRLEFRNVRSAKDRILLYLELVSDADTRRFALAGSLQDIAAELGLTREAFYRALAELERGGMIGREGRTIVLQPSSV